MENYTQYSKCRYCNCDMPLTSCFYCKDCSELMNKAYNEIYGEDSEEADIDYERIELIMAQTKPRVQ